MLRNLPAITDIAVVYCIHTLNYNIYFLVNVSHIIVKIIYIDNVCKENWLIINARRSHKDTIILLVQSNLTLILIAVFNGKYMCMYVCVCMYIYT